MTTYLLDVNVLVALMWPAHEAHAATQTWFSRLAGNQWATCPLTQAGFVRIVSNPSFSPQAVSPTQALDVLTATVAHPRHIFWPDDRSVPDALRPFQSKLTGHRQIADAYLLGLAVNNRGVLATLDRGILALAAQEKASSKHVQLIAIRH